MRTKLYILSGLLVMGAVLFHTPAAAQVIYGQPTSGNLDVVYSSWTTEDDGGDETTVSQLMFPVSGFLAVQDNFDITFFAANAACDLDNPVGEYSLNGFSDVYVQGNRSFAGDQLLLSVGLTLPTGKKALDFAEEWQVLQALSYNYFDFPVRHLGEGLGMNAFFGGAAELAENVRGGAGIRYQYTGSYEPYEDYEDYNPGDIVSLNAGVDWERGPLLIAADAVWTTFFTDKLDDVKTFRQSNQFDVRVAGSYAGENTSFSGSVRYVIRGDNKLYDSTGVELEPYRLYGDEFSMRAALGWALGDLWTVTPSVDLRLIGGNDVDFDNSTIYGGGGSVSYRLRHNVNAVGGFKLYTGSADGGDLDVSGYQLTFGLTASM